MRRWAPERVVLADEGKLTKRLRNALRERASSPVAATVMVVPLLKRSVLEDGRKTQSPLRRQSTTKVYVVFAAACGRRSILEEIDATRRDLLSYFYSDVRVYLECMCVKREYEKREYEKLEYEKHVYEKTCVRETCVRETCVR